MMVSTDQLFSVARTQNGYLDKPVSDATLHQLYELMIMAARALGLDCGPMSGFDAAKMDAAFWADTKVRTNFICASGHGDPSKVLVRHPRLSFDETCCID